MKQLLLILFNILIIGCSGTNLGSADKLWDSAIDYRKNDDLRLSISTFKSIIQKYPESLYIMMNRTFIYTQIFVYSVFGLGFLTYFLLIPVFFFN